MAMARTARRVLAEVNAAVSAELARLHVLLLEWVHVQMRAWVQVRVRVQVLVLVLVLVQLQLCALVT